MRGCPRTFATKQDYLNGIATYPEETKAALRRLIAARFEFVQTAELADGEEGIEDENHAIVTSTETDSETGEQVTKRIQLEKALPLGILARRSSESCRLKIAIKKDKARRPFRICGLF